MKLSGLCVINTSFADGMEGDGFFHIGHNEIRIMERSKWIVRIL
jgi:hypothetical protein